ncbi:hypothetical protein [Algoriphagus machipongonensis]|uniref:Uncharacterized protein n=1 Tax=Algoriphagus machipongonensis TaxID=388413 RepID=A3HSK6_9BACT|nr:hypothetical protein [Algoriphagus machipongonensis]EAZ82824.1 hypothetical protein ALPR1_11425 [Algoriphagus machipongonensis]
MSVEDEIERIMAFTSVGLTSLEVLLFPVEEVAEMGEQDLGFISTASKALAGVGMISVLGSMGLLYHRKVEIPTAVKWILIPILILDVALLASLLGLTTVGTGGLAKAGKFAMKYIKPAVYSLAGVGVIVAMCIWPKTFVNVNYIGKVIYYLPAGLGYPPINKHPLYAVVILVRTGGLITSLAGEVIELMHDPKEEKSLEKGGDQAKIELT